MSKIGQFPTSGENIFDTCAEIRTHLWARPAGRGVAVSATPLLPKIGGCSPGSRGPFYRVSIAFPLRSLCSALVRLSFLGPLKSRVLLVPPSVLWLGSGLIGVNQSPQFCGQFSGYCPAPGDEGISHPHQWCRLRSLRCSPPLGWPDIS